MQLMFRAEKSFIIYMRLPHLLLTASMKTKQWKNDKYSVCVCVCVNVNMRVPSEFGLQAICIVIGVAN